MTSFRFVVGGRYKQGETWEGSPEAVQAGLRDLVLGWHRSSWEPG